MREGRWTGKSFHKEGGKKGTNEGNSWSQKEGQNRIRKQVFFAAGRGRESIGVIRIPDTCSKGLKKEKKDLHFMGRKKSLGGDMLRGRRETELGG